MKYLGGIVGSLLIAVVLAGCSQSVNQGDAGGDASMADRASMDVPTPPRDGVDIDAPEASMPQPDATDAYINIFEVFPLPETGAAGECATCVESRCGTQVNNCVNNAACRAGFACTLMRCLGPRADGGGGGGGGLDLACINTCFMGDLAAAAQAVGAVTCLVGTCGMTCAGVFGGGDGGTRTDASAGEASVGEASVGDASATLDAPAGD